jgi:ketosteroid isomerase-like protein
VSQENVNLVRSLFEPLEGIDATTIDWSADAVRDLLGSAYTPDVELTTLNIEMVLDIEHRYVGVDGVAEYLSKWLEPFSEYHLHNLDYIAAGDCVLVPSRQWGIGEGSGARVELELTTLYEVRDGKIARAHQYETLAEARAAAES